MSIRIDPDFTLDKPDRPKKVYWWDTPEYQAERTRWYQRLKAEGFQDCEWSKDSKTYLAGWLTGQRPPSHSARRQGVVEEYYRLAGWYLHDTDWSVYPDDHRWIWKMHSDGQTNKKISDLLYRRHLPLPAWTRGVTTKGKVATYVSKTVKEHFAKMRQRYVTEKSSD